MPNTPNRRAVLGGAAAATLAACTSTEQIRETIPTEPQTYLLVHGAWHGGWCWRDVRARLQAGGHRVYTPTLTGLGERAHLISPDVSLQTHIEDVGGVIEAEELSEIVLVGHSYGGMIITGVVDRWKDRVSKIIYLDAALPRDGESMLTQGAEKTTESLEAIAAGLSALAPDGVAMTPPSAGLFGVPDTMPETIAWIERRLTPHPLRTWYDPIVLKNGGPEGVPSLYIQCIEPVLEGTSSGYHADRLSGAAGWSVIRLATGHDAMITAPDDLTSLLMS